MLTGDSRTQIDRIWDAFWQFRTPRHIIRLMVEMVAPGPRDVICDPALRGAGELQQAKEQSHGLGLFVRSLVGLDREAAKQAFLNHLTEHGVMNASSLYESPFTDITPTGPDGLFPPSELDELLAILDHVRAAAVAA